MRCIIICTILFLLLPIISFSQEQSCDYKVEILVNGEEFDKLDFKWRMKATKLEGSSTNITGTAEIKDSSGKTVKSYKPWTSDSISRYKTSTEYSPNLQEGETYEITAEIKVDCDDTNKDNNVDIKTIKINGEKKVVASKKSSQENSISQIDKNKDETSQASTEQINNKNSNVQTKTTTKKPAPSNIEGNVVVLKSNNNQENLQAGATTAAQSPQMIYQSSGEKIKNLILIFLLTLSILLNIVLIWRR